MHGLCFLQAAISCVTALPIFVVGLGFSEAWQWGVVALSLPLALGCGMSSAKGLLAGGFSCRVKEMSLHMLWNVMLCGKTIEVKSQSELYS